jgi:hypothetical protein
MNANTVRWNVAVSTDTDKSLRMFLAGNGRGKKGDLSRAVEEAVLSYIFDRTAERIKADNEGISEEYIGALVDEGLGRTHRFRHRRNPPPLGEGGYQIGSYGKPQAALTSVTCIKPKKRIGILEGRLIIPEDFDAPLPDDLLAAFDGE